MTTGSSAPLTRPEVILWIFTLAFLSVGARNFEPGITLDGPFYATIARNIARSGDWFTLNPSIPDLNPFYGNPHLGLWVYALWMKVFPGEDWSLRIVNHLYYVGFLTVLFHYVRRKTGELSATLCVVVLWTWFQFSNTHSNIYLDPGALFWGILSVVLLDLQSRLSLITTVLSGVCLALCALCKSMTFVGFLPVLILVASQRKRLPQLVTLAAAFGITGFFYCYALKQSSQPAFLESYWRVQITNRFARVWHPRELFSPDYWRQLLYYTYYLAPLSLLAFRARPLSETAIPATLSLSFIAIFSLSHLAGGQYLIMVMPPLAWLIALSVVPIIPFAPRTIAKFSGAISLLGVCLIQYLPFPTHARSPTPEQIEVGRLSREGRIDRLVLDIEAVPSPFVISAPFAWYGDVTVSYPVNSGDTKRPELMQAYFLHRLDPQKEARLKFKGWCNIPGRFQEGSLWIACGEKRS